MKKQIESNMETTQVDHGQHADQASNSIRRILVLLAHPSLDRSEVNRPMAEAIDGLDGITLIDLYAEYPDFQINIDREQAQLIAHDVKIHGTTDVVINFDDGLNYQIPASLGLNK